MITSKYLVGEHIKLLGISIILVSLFTTSCGRSVRVIRDHYSKKDIEINLVENSSKELAIHYTGCGGVILERNALVLTIDPFFSNTRLFPVVLKTIFGGYLRHKEKFIRHGINRSSIDIQKSAAVLVSHAHYDHLMDVPWLYKNDILYEQQTVLIGNASMNYLMSHYEINNLINVEPMMSNLYQVGNWITTIPNVRILPIESQHAPHVGHIKAFAGEYTGVLRMKKNGKTHISDWREGKTLAYIIDIMKNESIDFRIFVQSSASDDPIGQPHLEVFREKTVDLAILGAASHDNSNNYPHHLIDLLKPKAIMIVHWENFFRSYTAKKPRTVIGTDVKDLTQSLSSDYGSIKYWLPKPGTTSTIHY